VLAQEVQRVPYLLQVGHVARVEPGRRVEQVQRLLDVPLLPPDERLDVQWVLAQAAALLELGRVRRRTRGGKAAMNTRTCSSIAVKHSAWSCRTYRSWIFQLLCSRADERLMMEFWSIAGLGWAGLAER